jgi:GxxExxY protein
MNDNAIATTIVHGAYLVHTSLGPGLFESVYEVALAHELTKLGLSISKQHPIPVVYDSVRMKMGFRADLLVERRIIVEVKAVEAVAPIHRAQVLTYLRVAGLQLGLLINFNVPLIKNGIFRVVNNLRE